MRILIQSSVFLPTPSPGAGAVEYLVAELAKGLAARGHTVLLFALEGSDSDMSGVFVYEWPAQSSPQATEVMMADGIQRAARNAFPVEFDDDRTVLFDHSCWSMAQSLIPSLPVVSMCHGMAPRAAWARNWVFTSEHHGSLHGVRNAQALHLGVDVAQIPEGLPAGERSGLLWVGRIMAYKQLHVALDIAKAADMPITVAGPVVDNDYWSREILPRLYVPKEGRFEVKMLNEVPHDEVLALMRTHQALLFTSNKQEPAGLVMLEALASGCPVLAFQHGANVEYLSPFRLYDKPADMVEVLHETPRFDGPGICRQQVSERFSIERMVERAETYLGRAVKGESW